MRAFCYFYLVNLYGDVPLVLSTDWKINLELQRNSKVEVYDQIIADLKDAKKMLSDQYLEDNILNGTIERVKTD